MTDEVREVFVAAREAAVAAGKPSRPAPPPSRQIKEPPAALLTEMAETIKNWSESAEGKAVKQRLVGADSQTIATELSVALSLPTLQGLLNKVLQYIPVQAVSVGLFAQGDFVGGVAGTIGYAVDLVDLGTSAAVYAGGGFVEGVDAGGEVAINLGFWTQATSEINGFYAGASIDVVDGFGVDGIVFGSTDDNSPIIGDGGNINWDLVEMLFIGVDAGADDGGDGDEWYFLSYNMSNYPTYQGATDYTYMLCVDTLSCINSYTNTDVVYWLYTIDGEPTQYVAPFWNQIKMTEPDNGGLNNWGAGNMIKFNESVTVTLHVGKSGVDHAMPTMTFNASDFNGLYNSVQKSTDTKVDVINEIKYTFSAFRVK